MIRNIRNSQQFSEKLKKTRSKVLRKYIKEKKRIFVRILLAFILGLNKRGALKKRLMNLRKQQEGKSAVKHPGQRLKLRKKIYQICQVKRLVNVGIKESLMRVLKSNEIIKTIPHSDLFTYSVKSNFKSSTFIELKGQRTISPVQADEFISYQSIFADKIQSIVNRSLAQKGPLKYLQIFSANSSSFAELNKSEPIGTLAHGFWDMFQHAKNVTKKIEKKKAKKAMEEKIRRRKLMENPKGPRRRVTESNVENIAQPLRVSKPPAKKEF